MFQLYTSRLNLGQNFKLWMSGLVVIIIIGCNTPEKKESSKEESPIASEKSNVRTVSDKFKDYWYQGTAEITSYQLTQERYGELRDGTAATIFVTEDFLIDKQLKADGSAQANDQTVSVLKLNITKKFITGIYPYSIMTSSFNPIATRANAIKVTNSVQEWCGQTYMQLNNRDKFELTGHSYFAEEGDVHMTLDKNWLEDELWGLIRINPEELPTGNTMVIPSFEYIRLHHKDPKAYKAYATLMQRDSLTSYTLEYPTLKRELTIYFNSTFPFEIEKWEEKIGNNQDTTAKMQTTAVKMKRIKTPYWKQNRNSDKALRDTLQLN